MDLVSSRSNSKYYGLNIYYNRTAQWYQYPQMNLGMEIEEFFYKYFQYGWIDVYAKNDGNDAVGTSLEG